MTLKTSPRTRCVQSPSLRNVAPITVAALLACGLTTPAFAQDETQTPGYCETHPDGQSFWWNIGRFIRFCPDSDEQNRTPFSTSMPMSGSSVMEEMRPLMAPPAAASGAAAPTVTQVLAPPAPSNDAVTPPAIAPQTAPAAMGDIATQPPTAQPTTAQPATAPPS